MPRPQRYKKQVGLFQVYEKGLTPICLDLLAQVGSFITVAKVSHRDIHAMTSKQACGHRAETATCTRDQGNAIDSDAY